MEQQTILVVDDNKEIVFSLGKLLEYEGYRILKAYDGIEALDVIAAGKRGLNPVRCDDAKAQRTIRPDEDTGKQQDSGHYFISKDGGKR